MEAPISRLNRDDWVRWAIGGAVAGLVAWGAVNSRISTIEVKISKVEERALEDRVAMKASVDRLIVEISFLRDQLYRDELARASERKSKP